MSKLTSKEYKKIAKAFIKAGYDTDKAFKALKKGNWEVTVKGNTYKNVYASRVLALMYESQGSGKGVSL